MAGILGLLQHIQQLIKGVAFRPLFRVTSCPCRHGIRSDFRKMRVLGVRKDTLDTAGAVSPEVAEQMAAGVARALGADIGVGITGVAGPGGGTEDKPVGLVYISVWYKGQHFTREMRSSNGRDRIRMQAASTALDLIRRKVF